jgi:hypothetical protein
MNLHTSIQLQIHTQNVSVNNALETIPLPLRPSKEASTASMPFVLSQFTLLVALVPLKLARRRFLSFSHEFFGKRHRKNNFAFLLIIALIEC